MDSPPLDLSAGTRARLALATELVTRVPTLNFVAAFDVAEAVLDFLDCNPGAAPCFDVVLPTEFGILPPMLAIPRAVIEAAMAAIAPPPAHMTH